MAVYLDNSATTAVLPSAAEKVLCMMTHHYGNPSSLHTMGFDAEKEVTNARKNIATMIGADASCITFTSGGTEANNIALLGVAESNKRRGNHIIISAIEHPSVLKPCEFLEQHGYEITRIIPREGGNIHPEDVLDAIRDTTILISIMMVNNETGAIFPWDSFASKVKKQYPQIVLHCDAVQAFGKYPISLKKVPIDLLSCSGHKIGAPKGIGALYIRKGTRIKPVFALGGGQESGLRSGTENTPGIVGFGEAVMQLPKQSEQAAHYEELYSLLESELIKLPNVRIHKPNSHVSYICHFSLCGVKSETLVHFLAQKEIYVSGGSACAKGNRSHVLTAMNLPNNEIDSSLRVSMGPQNTKQDILSFIEALKEADSQLVHTNERRGKNG